MKETNGQELATFDVVVIGGGAAGLSGALTLARARRSVLVIDSGEPRNAPAGGVHGFLSREGISPLELIATGASEVRAVGGQIARGRVTAARRTETGFAVLTDDGSSFGARRLLVTTGLVDELPEVEGVRARWGRDVLHCPYCHGWEVRDEAIGVLSTSAASVHQALLFRQWSDDVTLFLHTGPAPDDTQWEDLVARGIGVVEGEVAGLEVENDRLTGVRLTSGRIFPRTTLVVAPRFAARDDVLAGLGLFTSEHPWGVGSYVESDPAGLTRVPGVWAAGNVADLFAGVAVAAGSGVTAAAAINADLVAEDTRRAVARRRQPFNAEIEARVCEQALGDRRHGLDHLREN